MLQAVATARVSRDHVYDQLQYILDQLRDPEVGYHYRYNYLNSKITDSRVQVEIQINL
jgi:hypothetical protein